MKPNAARPHSKESLALHGGQPAVSGNTPPWPVPDPDVESALRAAYRDGSWGTYHGPHSQRLVEMLRQLHDVEFVTLCSSGTIAVELALRGIPVGPGDEVILAGYDFPGNFRCIEAVGGQPVLVDIDPDTWCLNVQQLSEAISSTTKAVIVSHLHGGTASMKQIRDIADDHGLAVIEDACQAPGATVNARVAGTWGDAGVLSFGGSKLLTAGRGGALVTRRADLHQRVKIFCERGNNAFPLSELQAAVLPPQLEKLKMRNQQRLANVQRLLAALDDVARLQPVRIDSGPNQPCFYKVAWLYRPDPDQVDRQLLIDALQAEGVAVGDGFRGFARRSNRRCRRAGSLDHSRRAAEQTILLHHPVLLEPPGTMDQVAAALKKVIAGLGVE